MEIIKKKLKLVTVTGITNGNVVNIVDTSVSYGFKILLNSDIVDIGFFDTLESSGATGATIDIGTTTITGVSSSRLLEVKKYGNTGSIGKRYFTSTSSNKDGLNKDLTTEGTIYVYYLSGITYTDTIVNSASTTTFSYISSGYDSPNFDNFPIFKDESKQNIISQPEVDSSIFILRESIPVFEDQFRLRNIKNVTELDFYAGGAHFNIVKNT